jgi:septal ring factor EnvC (AmiA/AmiB activator)
MKLAIIILIVLLLVAVLTCLSMWAAVSQYRTECRQWRTECQDVKKKYDNEVEHREWALSHLKAQTTRAEYLQAQINKANKAAAVKEWRNNKNKKKNNEQ